MNSKQTELINKAISRELEAKLREQAKNLKSIIAWEKLMRSDK
tara:strand:- start:434 stop:562 length:129 start_codon:yes stop_codon:yes gene_type:complete